MARRSRDHRRQIPGYDEQRPSPEDRAREHRRVRHAANQQLRGVVDPDDLEPLPEVRRERVGEPRETEPTVERRRFRVWKTKFWKRRDGYQDMKAALDARWEELVREEDEDEAW